MINNSQSNPQRNAPVKSGLDAIYPPSLIWGLTGLGYVALAWLIHYSTDESTLWWGLVTFVLLLGVGLICFYYKVQLHRQSLLLAQLQSQQQSVALISRVAAQQQKMQALALLCDGVAHDHNNILGIVVGYVELIEDECVGDDRLRDYIAQVYHAIERAGQLDNKLLQFSRQCKSGQVLVDFERTLLPALLRYKQTLDQNIQFEWSLAATDVKIRVDPQQLAQAVVMLADNAVTAMPAGGRLTFATQVLELEPLRAAQWMVKAGQYLQLKVIDSGSGIEPSIRDRVFDPYFSTHRGAGLGLSQVYGFVQNSEGVISIAPSSGQGTEIQLYFPLDCDE